LADCNGVSVRVLASKYYLANRLIRQLLPMSTLNRGAAKMPAAQELPIAWSLCRT
jgi:hypothetical protein